jgi:hypothetical protein
MLDESSTRGPRWAFQVAVNRAVATGEICDGAVTLGPMTNRALSLIAMTHPDASADDIADAYSAFDVEHGHGLTIQ